MTDGIAFSCPLCNSPEMGVLDSRRYDGYVRRRRGCPCGGRLTTIELVASSPGQIANGSAKLHAAMEGMPLERRRLIESLIVELGAPTDFASGDAA